jgi:trimeric autotransporter adhesin
MQQRRAINNRPDTKPGGSGVNRSRATFVALAIVALASPSFASDRASKAAINGPHQLAFDSFGNLYVGEEYGNRVLKLDPTLANVTVIAGNGHECCRKENVPALKSSVYAVYSIAVDRRGNVYIAGRNAKDGAFVRVVHAATRKIETLASGRFPAAALSEKSSDANLSDPKGIVVTPEGKVLVSADESHVVVELGRATRLVAGTEGQKGFLGDGGPASLARFDLPGAMAIDGKGNVFVADYYNHRVRRIDAQTGIITTVAGNGSDVSSGDGGLATAAGVHCPYALAVDSVGNLFVVENGTFRVRKSDATSGAIRTIAGTGNSGFSGDGGPATQADINPTSVAVDGHGNLYISDTEANRIRRVDSTTGIISTVAGNGLPHRKVIIE